MTRTIVPGCGSTARRLARGSALLLSAALVLSPLVADAGRRPGARRPDARGPGARGGAHGDGASRPYARTGDKVRGLSLRGGGRARTGEHRMATIPATGGSSQVHFSAPGRPSGTLRPGEAFIVHIAGPASIGRQVANGTRIEKIRSERPGTTAFRITTTPGFRVVPGKTSGLRATIDSASRGPVVITARVSGPPVAGPPARASDD